MGNSRNIFIDEIHTIVGAGSAPGSMDAANIMKPALSRGKIQCIGATTLDEYRNSIEKDGALERRFQKIVVNPTTEEETLQILRNIKDRYESHHRVTYSNEAIEACVKLTGRYIGDRQFPDKAIDALDETGATIADYAILPTVYASCTGNMSAVELDKALIGICHWGEGEVPERDGMGKARNIIHHHHAEISLDNSL